MHQSQMGFSSKGPHTSHVACISLTPSFLQCIPECSAADDWWSKLYYFLFHLSKLIVKTAIAAAARHCATSCNVCCMSMVALRERVEYASHLKPRSQFC